MGQYGYNHGDIGWTSLHTSDAEAGINFYTSLIGYEKKPGPTPDYHVFARGEEMLGGVTGYAEGQTGPAWVPYITVDDLDATLVKTKELGGSVVTEPQPLPDGGRIAIIKDPTGGVTGLAQYAKKS